MGLYEVRCTKHPAISLRHQRNLSTLCSHSPVVTQSLSDKGAHTHSHTRTHSDRKTQSKTSHLKWVRWGTWDGEFICCVSLCWWFVWLAYSLRNFRACCDPSFDIFQACCSVSENLRELRRITSETVLALADCWHCYWESRKEKKKKTTSLHARARTTVIPLGLIDGVCLSTLHSFRNCVMDKKCDRGGPFRAGRMFQSKLQGIAEWQKGEAFQTFSLQRLTRLFVQTHGLCNPKKEGKRITFPCCLMTLDILMTIIFIAVHDTRALVL